MTVKTLKSLYAFKASINAELFELLATVPAERADAMRSSIRTLNHIHVVDRLFRARLAGEAEPFDGTNTKETPTLDALRAAVAETDGWYQRYVAGLDAAALDEVLEFQFTDGDTGRMTREEVLLHVITHGGYHRGNVGQLLKSIDMTPPRDLYTRFLHQSEPARRA